MLLGTLCCLSFADGLLGRLIIPDGLYHEANFWISGLAFSHALIAIKRLGTVLAI